MNAGIKYGRLDLAGAGSVTGHLKGRFLLYSNGNSIDETQETSM